MKTNAPYAQVAKQALINWKELTPEQAEKLIAEFSFEEIEEKVGARNSVVRAVDSIGRNLGLDDAEIVRFANEVFGQVESTEIIDQLRNNLAKIDFSVALAEGYDHKTNLIVNAMEAVHDGWVEDNAKHFFGKKADIDQQYQYLPMELIGWEEAKLDLLFIEPIANSVGISVDEAALRLEYDNRTMKLLDYNFVETMSDLSELIATNGFEYDHWAPEIEDAMADQQFVNDTIMVQLKESGFMRDEDLMRELNNKQVFSVDGPEMDELEIE